MRSSILIIICLSPFIVFSQTLKGIVLDAKTKAPIESAAIYFDNTTIGTSTNDKGEFEITYNENIKTPLIISFLGYEKLTVPNYSPNVFYRVLLEEQNDVLEEVVIIADDGMSRALKLEYFKAEFLGKSDNGKSCVILNEDDLILRYDKTTKQLTASCKKPLMIMNNNLKYRVQFDIKDFVLTFSRANLKTKEFVTNALIYTGTSFFESMEDGKSIDKKRNRTYKGSILHFMRAISRQQLLEEGYTVFSHGFKVNHDKYISVKPVVGTDSVEVHMRLPLSVMYKKRQQSELRLQQLAFEKQPNRNTSRLKKETQDTIRIGSQKPDTQPFFNTSIIIDGFGNHSPIDALYFSGFMSQKRLGDTLPMDYEPIE